jgi:hypothetical protein
MERNILKLRDFVVEQETTTPSATGSTETTNPNRPETERETRSRIATSLVKNLLGGNFDVSTEGGDSRIDVTKEVKESIPYRGCGASEPFKIEKKPIGVNTFKILLEYLNSKKAGNYTRAIKELEENRALIIGVRNKIDIKKQTANQDRFTDSLYFIPGNSNAGKELASSKVSKKNESVIFEKLYEESKKLQKERGDGVLTYEEFYSVYENYLLNEKEVDPALGIMITPYQITTVPSLEYYGKRPLNPKGTGIKMPGDTLYFLKESTLGHGTYKMLVEGEKIKVGRYPIGVTKYETYKPADVYEENCGMQIHRSSTKGVGICVGPWSGGCQVFADYQEFKELISKCERETMNANKFIYALINLDDIEPSVMENALKGISTKSTVTNEPVSSDKPKKESSEKIEGLVNLIKSEKEKTNSDEDKVIAKYNEVIKSEDDMYKLIKLYGKNLWDDLDSFLSGSEIKKLNYRDV